MSEVKTYRIEEIMNMLPHRYPFLLVDRLEVEVPGEKGVGIKNVTMNEEFFQGHFPGNPVVPGVVLCEMMAQTCCVLLAQDQQGKKITPYFTSLDKVKFKNKVLPGDTLEMECQLVKVKGPFYFAKGKGCVNGKLCVSGEFSFACIEQ